jgi:hypothetical protein
MITSRKAMELLGHELKRDFREHLVSIRRTCEVQPLIREAKPGKPVPLGPSDAGQLATIYRPASATRRQMRSSEGFQHSSSCGQRLRPVAPRWCHAIHTHASPRKKRGEGLAEAIGADFRPPACSGSPRPSASPELFRESYQAWRRGVPERQTILRTRAAPPFADRR